MREVRIKFMNYFLWLCCWICNKDYSDNILWVGGRSEEWDESVRDR